MLINQDELRMAIPFYQSDFPKRIIIVKQCGLCVDDTEPEQTYIPLVKATADIKFMDDDFTIGNCHCSNCGNSIGIFDKFCSHCGAKISGRREVHDL